MNLQLQDTPKLIHRLHDGWPSSHYPALLIAAEGIAGVHTLTLRSLQLPHPRRDFVWALRFRIVFVVLVVLLLETIGSAAMTADTLA